jgi:hypothetical protein
MKASILIMEIHEPKPKDNLKSLVKEMFEALEKGQTIKSESVYHYALKGFFSDAKQK